MDILDAIKNRRATRAFLDKPVSKQIIESILEASRWSPSGVNSQPWHVSVVQGKTKKMLSQRILEQRANDIQPNPDYSYYPTAWKEPYRSRRKDNGLGMYQALGIGLRDLEKRTEAWNRNYTFFDAPVGLIIMIDRDFEQGSWIDLGMFIQSIMISAKAYQLDTCPQASIAEYPDVIREELEIPAQYSIACGIALGYADTSAAVNQFKTGREPIETFTRWYD